jgi:hypothetical protein
MSLASGLGEQQPWRLLLHGGDAGSGRSSLAVGVWRTDPVGGGRHRRLVSPLTPPPRPPCQGAADLSPGHGRLLPTWGGGGSGATSPTLWTACGGRILRMAADTVTSAAPRPTSSLTRHGGCRQRRPPPLPPRLRVSSSTMRPSWCGARPASPMWLHLAKGVWLGVGMGGRQDCI